RDRAATRLARTCTSSCASTRSRSTRPRTCHREHPQPSEASQPGLQRLLSTPARNQPDPRAPSATPSAGTTAIVARITTVRIYLDTSACFSLDRLNRPRRTRIRLDSHEETYHSIGHSAPTERSPFFKVRG